MKHLNLRKPNPKFMKKMFENLKFKHNCNSESHEKNYVNKRSSKQKRKILTQMEKRVSSKSDNPENYFSLKKLIKHLN